jgi:tRNA(Ile)-lysidine synthase
LLVAVSGGADSTALLAGLARIAHEFGLTLEAAHLHHRLRGRAADADLEAVRTLCGALKVPLHAARWNTRDRMRRRGMSGQNGLRRLRREFLEQVATANDCAAIATAHTADDQLETLLLRLARGTGLAGMAGIRPRSGPVIRPLLMAPRAAIEEDLARAGIAWREDASNLDPAYARNRIRLEVVPALARATSRTPGAAGQNRPDRASSGAARLAIHAARATLEIGRCKDLMERRARQALRRVSCIQGREIDLDSRKVGTCPSALQRTMLRAAWEAVSGSAVGLTAHHLDGLARLVRIGRVGARVLLPGGEAIRGRTHLKIRMAGPAAGERSPRPGRAGRQTGAVVAAGR